MTPSVHAAAVTPARKSCRSFDQRKSSALRTCTAPRTATGRCRSSRPGRREAVDFLEQGGAARCIQMGGDFVQQQDSGARPSRARDSSRASASMMEIRSAFCSPVEQSRASARLSVWRTARSVVCGPTSVRPASASRMRLVAKRVAQGLRRCRQMQFAGRAPATRPGRRRAAAAFGQGAVQPFDGHGARLRRSAMPASAISFSSPSSQAGSRGPYFRSRAALAHRGFIARGGAGMARHRSPAPAGPGNGRRPLALSMNSRSIAGVSQIICTISPRSAELCAATPFSRTCAGARRHWVPSREPGADFIVGAAARHRGRHGPQRFRLRRPEALCGYVRRAWRRAGRGPATAARSRPAHWSCPRHWGPPAPPARPLTASLARGIGAEIGQPQPRHRQLRPKWQTGSPDGRVSGFNVKLRP